MAYNPKTFLGFNKAVIVNLATKQINKPSYNNQYAYQNSAKQKNGYNNNKGNDQKFNNSTRNEQGKSFSNNYKCFNKNYKSEKKCILFLTLY